MNGANKMNGMDFPESISLTDNLASFGNIQLLRKSIKITSWLVSAHELVCTDEFFTSCEGLLNERGKCIELVRSKRVNNKIKIVIIILNVKINVEMRILR